MELGKVRRAKTRARIIAAAFELFGEDEGLHARIEDVVQRAGITRTTFYDHFSGIGELREAVSYEVTHDFLTAVNETVSRLGDTREKAAAAIRFYMHRVREVPCWGRSMINLSASGIIFGAETYQQSERTVAEGMAAGQFAVADSGLGRDIVLGTTIAAIATMLREVKGDGYPEAVTAIILRGLGVDAREAEEIARRALPPLAGPLQD